MSTSAGFRIHLATTQEFYVSAHPFTHQGRSELWPCPPPWPPLLEKRFATICVRAGAVRAATRALEYRREDWRLRRAVGRIRGIVSVVNGFQCRNDSEVRKWLERASKLFLRSSGTRGSSRSDVHPISPIRPLRPFPNSLHAILCLSRPDNVPARHFSAFCLCRKCSI